LRVFVALDVNDMAISEKVRSLQRELLSSETRLKIVDPSNLHITLKFIGEVPDNTVKDIAETLRDIKFQRFTMHFKGVGVFPSPNRINVIWIGCSAGAEEASRLQKSVDERLSRWGKSEPGFKPHVTICRVKGGRREQFDNLRRIVYAHEDDDFGEVQLNEFRLKKSTLLPDGPVYEDLEVFKLV